MPTRPEILGRIRRRAGRAVTRTRLARGTDTVPASTIRTVAGSLPEGWFVNPVAEGADPYVTRDGTDYLWCHSVGDRGVAVGRSDRLTSPGDRRVVWTAPEDGPFSREVWAPELFLLDGRWHIYVAASDGRNENHRAYVLVADTEDPQGPYTLHGPLETGDRPGEPLWAIDMTVLEHQGRRYAVWSGWPDQQTPVQHLYLAPMSSPTELAATRVLLAAPYDFAWERIAEDRTEAINEAPQVLQHGGRTFLLYSCGSALLPSYKLGLLELVGADPADPASWRKHPEPVFSSTDTAFGVGHGTVVRSPDETEWWLVYHRKIVRERNFKRVIQTQPFTWDEDGLPRFGDPVSPGVALREPSGTRHRPRRVAARWDFSEGSVRRDFDYFGHQQFLTVDSDGLHLGRVPEHPVNAFRSGEKVVLRDGRYDDVRVTTRFSVPGPGKAVGVLMRTTGPAVGVDAQRGYVAAWVEQHRRLLIGRTDGSGWTLLGTLTLGEAAGPGPERTLWAEARGSVLQVGVDGVDGVLEVRDDAYPTGSVGLRVVHAHAVFRDLEVTPLTRDVERDGD